MTHKKQATSYYVTIMFISILFASCSGLTGTNESECNNMYFNSSENRIVSTCSAMTCGREKITKIVVSTQATNNIEFNTILKDSSLQEPSYTYNILLDPAAVSKIKTKGITVMVYTGNSGIWYKLNVGPAAIGTAGKHFFTLYKRGL
jgi:hypothetical protein